MLAYLRGLGATGSNIARAIKPASPASIAPAASPPSSEVTPSGSDPKTITFKMFGTVHHAATASMALVDILRILADRDLAKIQTLADAIRTSKRSLIAHTSAEVNPARPDLARAASFAAD